MSLLSNLSSTFFPALEGDPSRRQREREIDASTRFAVLGLIKASVFWFFVTAVLGLIVSVKLHSPGFFGGSSWLSYGKAYPMFWNAMVYGWLLNAGMACVAWIVARLAGRSFSNNTLLTISTGAWNFAVALGLCGIAAGDQQPFHLLEFPGYVAPFLIAGFLGMGIWVSLAFKARAFRSAFASQWYALAAVFVFVWVAMVAYMMATYAPAQGVFQNVAALWYAGNLRLLVIGSLALATLYYLLPKTLGSPLVGYRQSAVAFWCWVAGASLSGLSALYSGPVPLWLPSLGIVATFLLFVPVTVISIQFLSSLLVNFSRIWDTHSLRYAFYSVVAFLVAMLLLIFGSTRDAQDVVQFTRFFDGVQFLFLAGFAGMAFTGGIYFILPRILYKELPAPGLVDFQFWIQGLGIFAIGVGMIFGGIQQGPLMNNSTADTMAALATAQAYFFVTTLGAVIFLCSSLAGIVSFVWILMSPRTEKERRYELIEAGQEMEVSAQ